MDTEAEVQQAAAEIAQEAADLRKELGLPAKATAPSTDAEKDALPTETEMVCGSTARSSVIWV
jgi:hypothetical protein